MRINEPRLRFVLQSRVGPVGRFLGRTGVRVESVAKALATTEGLVRTGRYRASITWRVSNEGGGLILLVGSPVGHARLLERGTPEHIIRPRTKKALWWDMPNDRGWMVQPDDGHPVRFVLHPGTRPYAVISRSVALVLAHGFRLPAGV